MEGDVFAALKARRFEEEKCLEFLDHNRSVLHSKCSENVNAFFNNSYGEYLYKRIRRPAEVEVDLKQKFKKAYANKDIFIDNRIHRNEEYVQQRKRDFAVSQDRVDKLIDKLHEEYEFAVKTQLNRCEQWCQKIDTDSNEFINQTTKDATDLIISSAVELANIADTLSFVPSFYNQILKSFHQKSIHFEKDSEFIPEFAVDNYLMPLRPDTQRLFVTMIEAFKPESMTPPLVERRGRAVCIITKPLVFNETQCSKLASTLGWRAVFATHFQNAVTELFELLSQSEEDLLIFGFPRTPKEYSDIYELFNPVKAEVESTKFLPKPIPSTIEPFDMVIELDISDETVLRDVLAELEDPENGNKYDIRNLDLDTVAPLVRLQKVSDPHYDIIQFAPRSTTMKANFGLIESSIKDLYHRVQIESREITEKVISDVSELVNDIPATIAPKYSPDAVIPSLLQAVKGIDKDIQLFFLSQWESIEASYNESVKRSFELLQQIHLLIIGHLEKARTEMQEFLCRPGSSQHLVIEFQEWHCTNVERSMRRIQKVKDECALRVNALRENLVQIENDRKTEEEQKQKDLLNAPFRTTLFELVNNACTMLAQAELDRWVSTRSLMLDFNQVVSDVDLVPPLPRRKLNQVVDPSRDKTRKGAKKAQRNTPTSRNRVENKLQPFESPLFEQLEATKKYVTDASVIYVRSTTPVSTRGKARTGKDKNPFAPFKISALEEFTPAFADDDAYLITRMDQINEFARDEINVVQQSFDAYVDDSTKWIQSHYERRKTIADTAIAYMLKRVAEEEQINHLIFFKENECTVDYTQMIVETEESPKIPAPFPEDFVSNSTSESAEAIMQGIVSFTAAQTDNSQ
ncbi:hypothetical protein TRFO_11208 [Tritrichomonas foetus]|uniref:CPC1/SPEF2 domain-containing protein n=1 Tax=Tritrichomonas foetus TaxID=1144522 RepID=A0A1J4J9L8_9EUKA|nr:hypothetical protein TRFO_11208 [Tritrichomonas foetus]|eukprot:OHS94347.1 hypothetical protein TRFO_11208 [Tritrichomonas foetus]